VICPDNPTFRKNNPFKTKVWEEQAQDEERKKLDKPPKVNKFVPPEINRAPETPSVITSSIPYKKSSDEIFNGEAAFPLPQYKVNFPEGNIYRENETEEESASYTAGWSDEDDEDDKLNLPNVYKIYGVEGSSTSCMPTDPQDLLDAFRAIFAEKYKISIDKKDKKDQKKIVKIPSLAQAPQPTFLTEEQVTELIKNHAPLPSASTEPINVPDGYASEESHPLEVLPTVEATPETEYFEHFPNTIELYDELLPIFFRVEKVGMPTPLPTSNHTPTECTALVDPNQEELGLRLDPIRKIPPPRYDYDCR
jgi:hypothetical protein